MENPALYEEATRYIEGQLSDEEREKFDLRLENDQSFAEAFSEFLVSIYLVKQQTKDSKKQALVDAYKAKDRSQITVDLKTEASPRRIVHYMMAAAASILVLLVGSYFWKNTQQLTNDQLFAQQKTETYNNTIWKTTRSVHAEFNQSFNEKDYQNALEVAKNEFTTSNEMNKPNWLEKQGFCYWEMKDWRTALIVFEELEKNKVLLPEKNPGLWYQALTYLADGDQPKTIQLLQKIAAMKGHSYQNKAKNLLANIQK